ncbi:MAG: elongation factor P [Deltaproteobacteria bacterium CG11_big_fil_rev_8_21_14_0_20_47_16]|nr:MAG: elongation factor P [Deltaproteobacteria bacterium CG11_big_fil_rev_8_21_14_0_20_47_16]
MITATQLKVGNIILLDGQLYRAMSIVHVTPGNWRGMVQTKLRSIKNGTQMEKRFGSDEKLEKVTFEQHEVEYLYADDDFFHFMNTENFEQIALPKDYIGSLVNFMLPGCKVQLEMYEGSPIGVDLPMSVTLTVADAEPTIKRGTASGSFKSATLETGLVVKVPTFIQAGDKIVVNTETGEYQERA